MLLLALALICAIYMGWSMGANDAANCVGADIGSGVMSLRNGVILTCVFGLLGALLLGSHVIKTIGKEIVPLHTLPCETANLIAVTALFGAGLWVTIATYRKYPVSTSHAIVGAVAGGGFALHTTIFWEKIGQIVVCWVLTPIGAVLFSLLVYPLLRLVFRIPLVRRFERPLILFLIYATSAYLAFTWGANDVANATGVLVGTGQFTAPTAAWIGALAIVLGIMTWGYKVIETVGFNITSLTPLMAIGVEVASALNVHVFTVYNIPVSTSHSIVGAIWGVGLIHGVKVVNLKLAREIVLTWAITPVVAGGITFVVVKLIGLIR